MKALKDPTSPEQGGDAETRRLNRPPDPSVQKRAAQLKAMRQELELFSYSVSHDFRAPLRHILGFAEILQAEAGDALDETGRQHLQFIAQSATRMERMLDALLEFSRLGRAEMRHERVSLAMLVEEARQELHGQIAGREIEWRIGDLPDVQGDPARLRQALVHLLSNAVKFTRSRAPATIEIGAENGGDETIFFIRDNGVGLDMPHADKLFGLFQRFQRAGEFEGMGVGLATVRHLMHQHGGRAWAEGIVDGGATFYLALPNSPEEPV